ncbi:MAG TPA: rhodanese-like domain-containing protein [Pyrinomonadaceae bacterium]|nr:rhodanese-like domain-containing protein [Pyrinomonadaceae bacterium]
MRTAVFSCALTLSALTYAAAACRKPAPAGGAGARPPQAAGQESSGREKDPFASVPRVTVEELDEALKDGRAVALDVRPAEAFEEGHIRGAVSIPEEEVVGRAGELPKDKLVVAYCA